MGRNGSAVKRKRIGEALGGIEDRYIEEAEQFRDNGKKEDRWKKPVVLASAAILFLSVLIGGLSILLPSEGAVVYAYTYGMDEELTKAGAVIHTGTISDDGEQKGHPLMFYLSGENIGSVRFSCKNQEIVFTDWTKKREEYGHAKNFTVLYGENEEEYSYLTIDWEPKETIRKLHEDYTIAELPEELKEDLIVMEITFMDGRQTVKAIRISLLSDGTFFAVFDDYKIGPSDSFVEQEDAPTLLEQSENRLFEKEREAGLGRQEAGREIGDESGTGNEETEKKNDGIQGKAARKAAEEYYEGTVFEVVSMREKSVSEDEVVFFVTVKKDGILQEPDRTIILQKNGEGWEMVNEGY